MHSVYVFFSVEGRGWFRGVIPASLQECSYDSIVNWAAAEMKRHGYKNFLVTENPAPFMVAGPAMPVAQVAEPAVCPPGERICA